MNECLWCCDPCEGKLCSVCNTCPHCEVPTTEHPLFHCTVDPRHTVPTLGHSCFECDLIAEAKARRAARNAPIIATLKAIRAQHVQVTTVPEYIYGVEPRATFAGKPWQGMEFGKALFGMMLDGAIKELES